MRRIALTSLAGLCCLWSISEAAGQTTPAAVSDSGAIKRRMALVIGNAAYKRQPLVNPIHDAQDMKTALERVGFTVTYGADLSHQKMESQIASFTKSLRSGDLALFYYSGHGMQIDGENLLVPVDFVLESEAASKEHCSRFNSVQRQLEQSGAALSVLVMDACRTNPFHRTRDWGRGLAPAEASLGTYLAFAASPGQAADDNPEERNGLFTKYLLESLQQPPPLSQIFRRVRDAVHIASNRAQTPFVQDQMIGDFLFTRTPSPAPASNPQKGGATPVATSRLQEAMKLYHQGNCLEAARLFDLVVRANPENAQAQSAAGVAYACQKLYTQAIPRYSMAIQIDPTLAAAYHNRGVAYMITSSYQLAVEDFDWAVQEEPTNSQNYTRLGEAHFRLRQYEDALKDFNQAIALNSSDAEAFHGLGQVLQRQGKYIDAIIAYDEALARKANFSEAIQDRESAVKRVR
jgi:tetratricopeptide (TPR) repeat protein